MGTKATTMLILIIDTSDIGSRKADTAPGRRLNSKIGSSEVNSSSFSRLSPPYCRGMFCGGIYLCIYKDIYSDTTIGFEDFT